VLRSLYSGISGLRSFQTKLDVVANNIANVNTYGFKASRTTFADLMSQTLVGAAQPEDNRGGANAVQIGLGVRVASTDLLMTQGSLQFTGVTLDLAVDGNGFFAVEKEGERLLTRSGNFYLDANGNVVTAGGAFLLDVNGNRIQIPPDAESFSVDLGGTVRAVVGGAVQEVATIGLIWVPNPQGLEKVGDNMYRLTPNATPNPAVLDLGAPGTGGRGLVRSGYLEMSNVDLAQEFTEMIIAQRGFQANARITTTSDEVLQELVNLKR